MFNILILTITKIIFLTAKFFKMKSLTKLPVAKWLIPLSLVFFIFISCQKEINQKQQQEELSSAANSANAETPPFNLEVILRGEGNRFGHVKFRQDNDVAKIIDLGVWVRDLEPNRKYQLQRAVDVVDGNCTSTTWLTLGKGLDPQSILTDESGKGTEELWRSIAMVPAGSTFDIHFRVVEENTSIVVLTSDCYQYTVR
ncbi:MAG: hypothetical protein M3O67_07050 [Bacteroidota bacterium]|nr:hypothetical protein [Bacteroidota bacterium]